MDESDDGSDNEYADTSSRLENDIPDLTGLLSYLWRNQFLVVDGSTEISNNQIDSNTDGVNTLDDLEGAMQGKGDPAHDDHKVNTLKAKGLKRRNNNRCHANGKKKNITQKILEREAPSCRPKRCTNQNFSLADKIDCNVNFFPNTYKTAAHYSFKAFVGTYSCDGDVFMTACQDHHIRLYETQDEELRLFRDISGRDYDTSWSIIDTSFSPDLLYLIYSSWSPCIYLCSIYGDHDTHMPLDLRPLGAHFCALSVSFSHDSEEIIAGGNDQCLYIYDRRMDERSLRICAHDDDINTVKFMDGSSKLLISGGDDGLCKVWDRRCLSETRSKPVGTFAGHTCGITHISSKGDGCYFISNSKDQSIKLWDVRKFSNAETVNAARRIVANQQWDYRWGSVPRRFQTLSGDASVMTYRGHSVLYTLIRAKFSPAHSTGQRFIYSGCASGSIVVYDVLTGQIHKTLRGGHQNCVRDVSWHPYKNTIMSTSWDCTVVQWDYHRANEDIETHFGVGSKAQKEHKTCSAF